MLASKSVCSFKNLSPFIIKSGIRILLNPRTMVAITNPTNIPSPKFSLSIETFIAIHKTPAKVNQL